MFETMSKELKTLNEVLKRLMPWVEQNLLSERRMESEFSILTERNIQLKKQNDELEAKIQKTIQDCELIVAEAKKDEQKTRAEAQILWTKAHTKFKEIEQRIDEADRKTIKSMLKDMEKVGA